MYKLKLLIALVLSLSAIVSDAFTVPLFLKSPRAWGRAITSLPSVLNNVVNGVRKCSKQFEADKESSRKLRRTVFTAKDWKKHRSSDRYFKELRKMPRSIVLRGLTNQALGVAFFSAIIVLYNVLIELKIFPWSMPLLSFPSLPFSLTSPSLGLLLVFRTNAAYARWREARIAWSTVSAKSNDLIREAVAWMEDKELAAALIRHIVAFSKCLEWQLGHKENDQRLQDDLTGVLTQSEVEDVMYSRDRGSFLLLRMTQIVGAQRMVHNVQSHMEKSIVELSKSMEVCDRIFTTPIPLVYTRHTARFLLLWLLTVPMSLYNAFSIGQKWVVPCISFLNSIFLFGIEDLGVQIEEPFTILPLANICHNIQTSAHSMLSYADIPWFYGTPDVDVLPEKRFRNDGPEPRPFISRYNTQDHMTLKKPSEAKPSTSGTEEKRQTITIQPSNSMYVPQQMQRQQMDEFLSNQINPLLIRPPTLAQPKVNNDNNNDNKSGNIDDNEYKWIDQEYQRRSSRDIQKTLEDEKTFHHQQQLPPIQQRREKPAVPEKTSTAPVESENIEEESWRGLGPPPSSDFGTQHWEPTQLRPKTEVRRQLVEAQLQDEELDRVSRETEEIEPVGIDPLESEKDEYGKVTGLVDGILEFRENTTGIYGNDDVN